MNMDVIKCLKKIHSLNVYPVQVNCMGNLWTDVWIGPLQLAIHVVQNRYAGEKRRTIVPTACMCLMATWQDPRPCRATSSALKICHHSSDVIVLAPRNVSCFLRLLGLLIRIYCGETLTILQLRAESHLVCLLREAWWKFESDSHPHEKLTREKDLSVVTLSLVHLEASWKVIKFPGSMPDFDLSLQTLTTGHFVSWKPSKINNLLIIKTRISWLQGFTVLQ